MPRYTMRGTTKDRTIDQNLRRVYAILSSLQTESDTINRTVGFLQRSVRPDDGGDDLSVGWFPEQRNAGDQRFAQMYIYFEGDSSDVDIVQARGRTGGNLLSTDSWTDLTLQAPTARFPLGYFLFEIEMTLADDDKKLDFTQIQFEVRGPGNHLIDTDSHIYDYDDIPNPEFSIRFEYDWANEGYSVYADWKRGEDTASIYHSYSDDDAVGTTTEPYTSNINVGANRSGTISLTSPGEYVVPGSTFTATLRGYNGASATGIPQPSDYVITQLLPVTMATVKTKIERNEADILLSVSSTEFDLLNQLTKMNGSGGPAMTFTVDVGTGSRFRVNDIIVHVRRASGLTSTRTVSNIATDAITVTGGNITWDDDDPLFLATYYATSLIQLHADQIVIAVATTQTGDGAGTNVASIDMRAGTETSSITLRADQLHIVGGVTFSSGDSVEDVINNGTTTISGGRLTTNSITATQIDALTITAAEIAVGTITATQIQAGTITGNEITGTTLSAIYADLGSITAGDININSGVFIVSAAGVVTITNATIAGWTIDATSISAPGDLVVLDTTTGVSIEYADSYAVGNRLSFVNGIGTENASVGVFSVFGDTTMEVDAGNVLKLIATDDFLIDIPSATATYLLQASDAAGTATWVSKTSLGIPGTGSADETLRWNGTAWSSTAGVKINTSGQVTALKMANIVGIQWVQQAGTDTYLNIDASDNLIVGNGADAVELNAGGPAANYTMRSTDSAGTIDWTDLILITGTAVTIGNNTGSVNINAASGLLDLKIAGITKIQVNTQQINFNDLGSSNRGLFWTDVLATTVSTNPTTATGWVKIVIDGATRWIQLYSGAPT